ncbi:hypothetical protein GCM10025787_32210 [Saccharopolyspora rosea]
MPDSAVLGHDAPAEQAAPDAAVFVALYTGHVLRAGLRLGLPDALGDEPASAAELADRMGLDPRALRRLLRALVALGFLDRTADGRYAHTPRSQLVRADDEFGRSLAAFATNPAVEQAWHGLAESVRTGRGPFAAHHGTDFYTYLSGDDGLSTAFRTAMRAGEEWIASSEIEALAQYASGTVVDVGGNRGALLRELLMRAPRARESCSTSPRWSTTRTRNCVPVRSPTGASWSPVMPANPPRRVRICTSCGRCCTTGTTRRPSAS